MSVKYSQMELDDVLERKFNAGIRYAEVASLYQRYDKGHDEYMRQLMANIRKEPFPTGCRTWSHENLKDIALASPEWSKFLDDYNEAYEKMLRALNERNHWETVFEAIRTRMATERAFAK